MAYDNVENLLRECTNPEFYNFELECDYDEYKAMSPLERFLVYKSTAKAIKYQTAMYMNMRTFNIITGRHFSVWIIIGGILI